MEEPSETDDIVTPPFSSKDINTVELPPCIDIKESVVHKGEPGAFAKVFIHKDTRFGPYKGEIINPGQRDFIDYRYAWEVHEKRSRNLKYTISALDPKVSNWMRHVNNARFYEEQNILSVQDGFSIFYVAMKNIEEGQELLTWFDPKLLKRTQRRQIRAERRPVGYTIELVPWSDEKKFTPEIIETKRSRKKKVLSDMIALDEDPKAMTRTLQSLPKIPCTPRQLGNMAYPLANSLKRKRKDRPFRPAVTQRNFDERRQTDRKDSYHESGHSAFWDKHSVQKSLETEKKPQLDSIRLNSLPPHENLKEALQAAENCPKLETQLPLPEFTASSFDKDFTGHIKSQDKKPKKRGRKRLSDLPRGRPRMFTAGIINTEYRPGVIRPLGLKVNTDGSLNVEDHDESYTLTGVTLSLICDDKCPCLEQAKCLVARDPPSAANGYAMGFTLLPEHKVVQNSRVVYKCDVCDGIYNHAFSLKRHYLSVHINHRYLTRDDIVSCQIETFHQGIQLEASKPLPVLTASTGNASPMPTFVAVNVSNLLPSVSPSKKTFEDQDRMRLQEIGNKLHCNEELTDEKQISKRNICREKTEKATFPTLASLAQSCLNKVALGCKVTTNSRVTDPPKPDSPDDQTLHSENSNGHVVSESSDEISKNSDLKSQAETFSSNSLKEKQKVIADFQDSSENSSLSIDGSNNIETLNANSTKEKLEAITNALNSLENKSFVVDDSNNESDISCATPCENDKSLNPNSSSINKDDKSNMEEEEKGKTALTKSKQSDANESEEDNTKAIETSNNVLCHMNGTSESNLEKAVDCQDETDSYVAFSSDKETISSKTADADVDVTLEDVSTGYDPIRNMSPKPAENVNPCTEENSVDSMSKKGCNIAQDSIVTEDKISAISQSPSSISSKASSTFADSPSSGSKQQKSTSLCQAVRTSAQPPVIFLTNIVFPVPGTLGQPIIAPQRPLTPSVSQIGTACSSAGTLVTSQPPTSLIQTMGSNVRLSGPRAPIPLVLISQVPAGVDPRNAANTFLKTSSGIKTLQDLQKSLSVAAVGNASTQLTASNMPCLIGPLCQGANLMPGTTTTSITSTTVTGPTITSTSLTNLPPKVSSSVPTTSVAVSAFSGSLATSSPENNVASHNPCPSLSHSPPAACAIPSRSITTLSSSVSTISSTQVSSTKPAHSKDHPEDLFRCHMCVLVFQTMQQLKHHIRNDPHRFKGGIKQYACLQCSMRFSTKSNLARHNLMNHAETEEYMFRCSTCGKGFSSETYLRMHARFHLGKSFPCKYGCTDLYFPNAAKLVKHLRTEHAGLDLKEYKRIHKIRPARRKKISQIMEPGPAITNMSVPSPHIAHPRLGQQGLRSPSGVVSITNIHGHVISSGETSSSKESSPYSLLKPGVGFQAKRGRPKGSKNKVKNGKPIIPSPVESPALPIPQVPPPYHPLTVEIPPAPEPIRRKRRVARFMCKICPKKFTTHLKLLRHRRKKHGMDQSVQEYLHIMSRNLEGYTSEPDQTVYSPPASPKTFFSNVNQRGYENFTQFIDGGPESLKSPIKKYIDIKDFSSISAPLHHSQEQQLELEWTAYNFPPSFKYNYDSTTFYDTEKGENFTALTNKRQASVEMGKSSQSEDDRDSTPGTDDIGNETVELLSEDPLALPEKPVVEDSDCTPNLATEPDKSEQVEDEKKPSLENLTNTSPESKSDSRDKADSKDSKQVVEDSIGTIGSKERGKQVIESLARHLACKKLPKGESDQCEFLSQEDDEGVDCDDDEPAEKLDIKAEPIDEDSTFGAGEGKTIDQEINSDTSISGYHNSETIVTETCSTNPSQSCAQNEETRKCKSESIESFSIFQTDAPKDGKDSGLSSLSSGTLEESPHSIESDKNSSVFKQDSTLLATIPGLDTKQSPLSSTGEYDLSVKKDVESLSQDQSTQERKLPLLNALDKNKLMRSLTIQGLLANDLPNATSSKVSSSPLTSCNSLSALNLCVPGGELTSEKLAQMIQSISNRQEVGSRLDIKFVRHRSISLPSFKEGSVSLNSSDSGKHHEHKRLSLWARHLPQKALDPGGEKAYHNFPIIDKIRKQQELRELETYRKAKAERDKTIDGNDIPEDKLAFAESFGLMCRADFNLYPKQKEYQLIKPPEVWANYENIWFGKRGTIVVVCSICHRHFSCWDLCLRHQLKKHPYIEPNFLQMEKGNYVDDMYYYYPMKYGILAKTEPIPSNLPLPELFVCTKCGFPFRNLNRLHAHMVSCDPRLEGGAGYRSFQNRKKLIPMMDRKLSQQDGAGEPVKAKLGRPFKRPPVEPVTSGSSEKISVAQLASPDVSKSLDKAQSSGSVYNRSLGLGQFSFYHGRKRKNYELLYNPQNHMRRRELYQVLDTHQCHGCNLKFKSMSMLERHVKKCSGRDKLQNQKPLLSGIMPDDAAVRKQHTCRYCNKRFTYIKGVDLHYKRICSVRKVREEEGKLTPEDLAHEEELRRIIEHLKWSKTLNKDSSDIIQGNVRVEEDGSLTRLVKKRGFPAGTKKMVKKRKVKNKKWTYSKDHRHANKSAASAANPTHQVVLRRTADNLASQSEHKEELDTSRQGQFGFQKRMCETNESSPPPPKKRTMSGSTTSVSDASGDKTSQPEIAPTGKRGRPRKYPVGDPRSRTPRLTRSNSSASKSGEPQDTAAQDSAQKPSSSEADIDTSTKPQPRKRGRPKKFDPSDMESSYKKKKRVDPALDQDSMPNGSDSKNIPNESGSLTLIPSEQSSGRAVTRRQQRAKMRTAAVNDDYVYEDPTTSLKKKLAPGRNKDKALSAQSTKDAKGSDEKPPFSEIELMEKMKQLKKKAQLDSDRCKLRQEQRKAKAKNLQELDNSNSTMSNQTSSVSASNSTELFKHLTAESTALSTKTKSCPSQKQNSHQVTTLPGSRCTPGGRLHSKESSPLNASKPSTGLARLETQKYVNSPKLLSASVQIKNTGSCKDLSSIPSVAFSPKSKSVNGETENNNRSKSENKTGGLQSDNKEPVRRMSGYNTESKNLKAPFMQLPECSVKVVTLSPKATSLISCKNKYDSTSIETCKKFSNESLQQKSNGEKSKPAPTFVTPDVKETSKVDKNMTQQIQTKGSSSPQKRTLEKSEEQTSEISIDLSLYSTGEELLKTVEKTSTLSHTQSCSDNLGKSVAQTQHMAVVDADVDNIPERSLNPDRAAGVQIHPITAEGAKNQAGCQDPAAKPPKRTKVVFLQSGKTPQIFNDVKYEGLEDLLNTGKISVTSGSASSVSQTASSQIFRLPTTISTLGKPRVEMSKIKVPGAISGNVDNGCQKDVATSSVPFSVIKGSTAIAKKSLSAPIKVFRGGLPVNKTLSVTPISSQRTMPVSTSMTTYSVTLSGSGNILASPSVANSCSPMTVLATETGKADTIKGQSLKQGEPGGRTNLTTHVQIKGGVVTHKPGIAQSTAASQNQWVVPTTASSVKPIHIVSSLNPVPFNAPACKKILSPKLISTATSVHLGPAGHVQPVISPTSVKTSAKIIPPPARVMNQTVSLAGSARPRLITPQKTVIQIPSAGMRPVQTSARPAPQERLQTGRLASTFGTATSNFPRLLSATAGNLLRPQLQPHVIRTLVPSKASTSTSTQHLDTIRAPSLASTNRQASTLTTSNVRTTFATKPSSSSIQHPVAVQSSPNLTTTVTPGQVCLSPETSNNRAIAEPVDAFSLSPNESVPALEIGGEPLVIKPPTNPIMITLEDGSTAMLDPESLAQLLSPVEDSVTNISVTADQEPDLTMMLPDPGSVMVNMAEIQPGQGILQTGEVLWEGFPDMSDTANDLFAS